MLWLWLLVLVVVVVVVAAAAAFVCLFCVYIHARTHVRMAKLPTHLREAKERRPLWFFVRMDSNFLETACQVIYPLILINCDL